MTSAVNIKTFRSKCQTGAGGLGALGGWGLPMGYVSALLCSAHVDARVDDRSMTAPQKTLLFSVFNL